ncbi:MAG: hypothetical protein AMXMBFR64_24570 [Myxococcales bacterium]
MKARARVLLAAVGFLTFAACGDDGDDSTPGGGDTSTEDSAQVDTGGTPDAGGGDTAVTPDVPEEDTGAGVDVGTVDTGSGADGDAGAPLCPDDQVECVGDNGLSDPSLCPNLTEFDCVEGCCVPVFKCKTDAECAPLAGTDLCADPRFDCRCDVPSGACVQFVCVDDGSCEAGEICSSGVCKAAPAVEDLLARIESRGGVTTEGAAITIIGEAYEADEPTVVVRGVELEWASSDALVATVATGADTAAATVTGGSKAGTTQLTVRVKGGTTWSAPVLVTNYAAPAATRVIGVDANSRAPLAQGWVLLRGEDGSEDSGALVDGAFESSTVAPPMDVHLFPAAHAYLSAYHVTDSDVLLMTAPTFRANLSIEEEGEILPEKQDVSGSGSIVTGKPDFSLYTKTGEIGLGITSLGIGDAVFSFDLPQIIGPDVERYYHPDAPSLFASDGAQELPGGVTFEFAGPVLEEFWLAGLPGTTTLWSLAGRVASNDPDLFPKISEIIGSIDDGINFQTLLSALFPLFKTFYSGVDRFLTLEQVPVYPPPVVDSVLTMPLVNKIAVTLPELPGVGPAGWADLALAIGGALSPNGQFTPLGITAGADQPYKDAPSDGIVDGDPVTEEVNEPLDLRMAPAHSGLQGAHTQLAVLVVAAALDVDGKSEKPEAGSAYVVRSATGENVDLDASAPAEGFLPISLGTVFGSDDPMDRSVKLDPVAGADFHRVVFRGDSATQWNVYLPPGVDEVEIPDPATFDPPLEDPAAKGRFVVNAFELEGGTLDGLLTPGGDTLDSLLRVVRRASYISVKK